MASPAGNAELKGLLRDVGAALGDVNESVVLTLEQEIRGLRIRNEQLQRDYTSAVRQVHSSSFYPSEPV